MTGDDHAFGGTAGRFDLYKSAQPSGVLGRCSGNASARRPTSTLNTPSHEHAGGDCTCTRASRSLPHVSVSGGLDCLDWTPSVAHLGRSRRRCSSSGRSTRASPPQPRRIASTVSAGPTGRPCPKVELANGIRLDTNYYHFPTGLDRLAPRLHDRLGHGHAPRRLEWRRDRRLRSSYAHGR